MRVGKTPVRVKHLISLVRLEEMSYDLIRSSFITSGSPVLQKAGKLLLYSLAKTEVVAHLSITLYIYVRMLVCYNAVHVSMQT